MVSMNERKISSKTNNFETPSMSMDEKHVSRRRALGAGAIAAGLLVTGVAIDGLRAKETAPTEITQETIDKFNDHQVPLESVQITNGAKLRENPGVDNDMQFGNKLSEVNIAELPSNYEITIIPSEDSVTFVKNELSDPEGPNHEWIGLPAKDVAEAIPGVAKDVAKDDDGLVWVSNTRASYEKTE